MSQSGNTSWQSTHLPRPWRVRSPLHSCHDCLARPPVREAPAAPHPQPLQERPTRLLPSARRTGDPLRSDSSARTVAPWLITLSSAATALASGSLLGSRRLDAHPLTPLITCLSSLGL